MFVLLTGQAVADETDSWPIRLSLFALMAVGAIVVELLLIWISNNLSFKE